MSAPDAAALILAAGLSSRMSGFKPLLPLDGRSILAHAAETFCRAGVERVLVVTGHRADEVEAEARGLALATVRNPDFAQGMFTSVRAGARALPRDCGAFFVLPVDIPLVRPWTVRLLLQAADEHPGDVLHPVFHGRRGHPPLLPSALIPAILDWTGPGGLAGLLDTLPGQADVPVADEGILTDMDDDAAYAQAQRRAPRLDIPTREECQALLGLVPDMHPMTLAHSRAVAHYALQMARAVNAARNHTDAKLDLELVQAAALLHDIAKGRRDHERRGGEMLRRMGLERTADIVATHRDMDPTPTGPVTETEIVYLADKVARGVQLVPVEERFQSKIDLYAHNPEAVAAIKGRRSRALASRERVERAAHATLDALLTQCRE